MICRMRVFCRRLSSPLLESAGLDSLRLARARSSGASARLGWPEGLSWAFPSSLPGRPARPTVRIGPNSLLSEALRAKRKIGQVFHSPKSELPPSSLEPEPEPQSSARAQLDSRWMTRPICLVSHNQCWPTCESTRCRAPNSASEAEP